MRKYQLLCLSIVLLLTVSAVAQNNCVQVRGIAQERLLDFVNGPDYLPLRVDPGRGPDPWVGPVQLLLSNGEILIGKISEYDGIPGPPHGTGRSKGGSYLFDFGIHGTFLVNYGQAEWPTLPAFTPVAIPTQATGTFHAKGSVDPASGTNRFAGATGNLATDGQFVAWNLYPEDFPPPVPLPFGRFDNTISGSLCGVAPASVAAVQPGRLAPLKSANTASQGCQAYHLHEFFDSASNNGSVYITLGGKELHSTGAIGEALNFVKQVGNVTFGNEKLRFFFDEGSFLLDAQFETIADPMLMARVNGRGDLEEGTGVFQNATGHLTYHGPFATDAAGNFTYLDIDYYGQVCPARKQ